MDSSSQHSETILKSRFRFFHRLKRNERKELTARTICEPTPEKADEQIDIRFFCEIENVPNPEDIDTNTISRELLHKEEYDKEYDEIRILVERYINRSVDEFNETQKGPEWLKIRSTNLLTFYTLFLRGCFKYLENRLIIIDGASCYEMDYVRNEAAEWTALKAVAKKFPNYATVMASQGYLDSTWHMFKHTSTDTYPHTDSFIGFICTNHNA